MDIESLHIFITVAAELSISKAAKQLGRVQSNVSTRIQQLETEVGVALFLRVGKRLELSHAGQRYLDYAKRIIALEQEAKHVVSGGTAGGRLRIGSMESTLASRLPTTLVSYHRDFPQTQIEITSGPSRQIIESVRMEQLDCCFAAITATTDQHEFFDELGLAAMPMWQEELLLLLPKNIETLKDVAKLGYRLAAFKQGCSYRAIAETYLDVNTNHWQINEITSYHVMLASVIAGQCIAVLPRSVLVLSGQCSELNTIHIDTVQTFLVWRKPYSVPAFDNFKQCAQESL